MPRHCINPGSQRFEKPNNLRREILFGSLRFSAGQTQESTVLSRAPLTPPKPSANRREWQHPLLRTRAFLGCPRHCLKSPCTNQSALILCPQPRSLCPDFHGRMYIPRVPDCSIEVFGSCSAPWALTVCLPLSQALSHRPRASAPPASPWWSLASRSDLGISNLRFVSATPWAPPSRAST